MAVVRKWKNLPIGQKQPEHGKIYKKWFYLQIVRYLFSPEFEKNLIWDKNWINDIYLFWWEIDGS